MISLEMDDRLCSRSWGQLLMFVKDHASASDLLRCYAAIKMFTERNPGHAMV